ncbi:hypothetical protein KF947_21340 [Halomonas sp. FeN2]|uniref:hypothetical protein n=1 Tax=Halomonas sp. FeN2 TaxID=2832500 RepID=UPI001D0B2CA1|nr:hypothetical protein [Halomonas sp. FeN2]UBR49822.1 hypothetical protein KF947_21340 [Halomonas sp. FeN2]
MSQNLPNRDRWTGWVALAWLLVVLAIIGGIIIISTAGYVEIPRQNSFGRVETVREPNVFVWAIAVGQAVSAAMLAAIFSMINSIYQNSCDQLAGVSFTKSESSQAVSDVREAQNAIDINAEDAFPDNAGLKVKDIHTASQLYGRLQPGDHLVAVNGHPVYTEMEAAKAVVKGENKILFINNDGERKMHLVMMKPAPLHIKFDT